jgi:hypothetical protein
MLSKHDLVLSIEGCSERLAHRCSILSQVGAAGQGHASWRRAAEKELSCLSLCNGRVVF